MQGLDENLHDHIKRVSVLDSARAKRRVVVKCLPAALELQDLPAGLRSIVGLEIRLDVFDRFILADLGGMLEP